MIQVWQAFFVKKTKRFSCHSLFRIKPCSIVLQIDSASNNKAETIQRVCDPKTWKDRIARMFAPCDVIFGIGEHE